MKLNTTRFTLLIVSIIGNHFGSFGQGFQKSYGGSSTDVATCIQAAKDGNYIIGGITTSFGASYEDGFLMKIDPAGGVLWSKVYGTSRADKWYYTNVCSDGGYISTGYNTLMQGAAETWDLFLCRTDSVGTIKWSKSYGGSGKDYGWYVTETPDKGFMAVGSSQSFGTGDWDGYIIKTDSTGILQWSKTMGGPNFDNFHGMSITKDSGFILTGTTSHLTFGISDIWLVKLKSNGDTLWTRQYGKSTEDAGNAVIETKDGGYLVAGDIHVNVGAGDHNSCMLKTDASGNLQWVRNYGSSPGSEIAWDVSQTKDKGFLLGGSSNAFGNGSGEMVMMRTDSVGNLVWSMAYGSTAFDDFWLFEPDKNEGFMVVGSTSQGGTRAMVIHIDSMGATGCDTTRFDPYNNVPLLQVRSGFNVKDTGTTYPLVISEKSVSMNSYDLCNPVSVSNYENPLNHFALYPNPASDHAELQFITKPEGTIQLEVRDALGRQAQMIFLEHENYQLDFSILTPGIYMYTVHYHGKYLGGGKLVITR